MNTDTIEAYRMGTFMKYWALLLTLNKKTLVVIVIILSTVVIWGYEHFSNKPNTPPSSVSQSNLYNSSGGNNTVNADHGAVGTVNTGDNVIITSPSVSIDKSK
jgi:hypothetical protein